MKILLNKFDDFIGVIRDSKKYKEVYYKVENTITPIQTIVNTREGEREVEVERITSIFRATSACFNSESGEEDWIGCNITLANEVPKTKDEYAELDERIKADEQKLIERMKDKLNDKVLYNGIVIIGK